MIWTYLYCCLPVAWHLRWWLCRWMKSPQDQRASSPCAAMLPQCLQLCWCWRRGNRKLMSFANAPSVRGPSPRGTLTINHTRITPVLQVGVVRPRSCVSSSSGCNSCFACIVMFSLHLRLRLLHLLLKSLHLLQHISTTR